MAAEGSVKTLLDAAASALTRANDELRRVSELLRQLREDSAKEPRPQQGGR